tara:strand:+ start:635 stop:1096 length:462 start_codon:yes stop_codon:yes gene_type:complete
MNNDLTMTDNMYYQYDFDISNNIGSMNNRLFCTFTKLEDVDSLVKEISTRYEILYNKIFIMRVKSNDEYVCTYNVDQGNISNIPPNTILVHRKKESNTLYTINALNELIKQLNGGIINTKYPIEWNNYQNTILLTQHSELKQLQTKIYKIVEV